MSNDINERLIELRKSLEMTQEEFGASIGVSRGVIKNIEYKVTEPKPLMIQQICKTHGVSETWLRTGEGEMFASASASAGREFLSRISTELLDCLSVQLRSALV